MVCNPGMLSPPSRRRLSPGCALGTLPLARVTLLTFITFITSIARAEEPSPPTSPPSSVSPPAESPAATELADELRALGRSIELDKRLLGSVEFGRGFRFDNPYRLATQLAADPRSVSLTAAYADLGAGVTFGPPDGLQHGGALHASFAMAGIAQAVLTPTYLLAYRGPRAYLAYGRLGPSFVLTPDPTVGAEAAGGFAWFFTGKIAVAGELVFDVYYGAGTHHVAIATYPIVSGQLGLLFDQELLP